MIVYNNKNNWYPNSHDGIIIQQDLELERIIIPFSTFMPRRSAEDIYTGKEKIPFKEHHPIYKAILKLEFEDAIKSCNYPTS
ncbi:MAG: hypothetical protein EU533_06015 [Promethearchaeota archaeon]|nr:MAG: hypothetical protein EU533_06015 [Candidatus Lokiarchaeota archaeon]